jgi:ABC-type nickel/cobalt efflux system permease component RcnA
MSKQLLAPLVLLALFVYGSYLAAVRMWGQPEPFLLGTSSGLVLGLALYCLARLKLKREERAFQDYASYVANTVSLVYLKHAPCPACGHSPQDEFADGFGSHSATCPILAEIIEFGKAPPE